MTERITLEIPVEISDVHYEWVEEFIEENGLEMEPEQLLASNFQGDGVERQVEELAHELHQQMKRETKEEQGTRRNPMR